MVNEDAFEKRTRLNTYFDFYGQLLTQKQRDVFRMYYLNDYSLGEISQELHISRQGVFDVLKRSEKVLEGYEKKLGLVKRFEEKQGELKDAFKRLKEIGEVMPADKKAELLDIIKELNEVIEELV
ncbi:YlxM family DNA-binding protein [Caldanaerobius fijiensis]|nr:YlxM family DNA-binding protein [Caldanaerobius fijiensis]